MPTILNTIILPLIGTLFVESIFIFPYFRSHCKSFPKLLINFLLINCITHLTLFSYPIISEGENWRILIFLLILFPLIEAFLYKYAGVNRNMKSIIQICYIANVLSYILVLYILWRQILVFYTFQPKVKFGGGAPTQWN